MSVNTNIHFNIVPSDDFRQLNDKLAEVNTSKMALQIKLDELESAEVNIKVSYLLCVNNIFTSNLSEEVAF